MRTLVLLRGTPASGKSTWIRENNLEQYTLSADAIRLLYQSPVLDNDGNLVISQNNDAKVWKLLFKLLEDRMARGEFTIIDATHYKSTLLNRYLDLIKKYRYRAIVADFTGVPVETLVERNNNRDKFKKVPEEAIRRMHAVFLDDTEVSNKFKVMDKDEVLPILNESMIRDFNHYKKVVFFGDIHGCNEPLKEYFKNGLDKDAFYIFLGDYTDRGLQNKEVLEFMISIKDKDNVLLLEGNHERHVRKYAEDDYTLEKLTQHESDAIRKYFGKEALQEIKKKNSFTDTFIDNTIPQIESIGKKNLRQFCRKLGQLAFFKFGDKVYLATHGGISNSPTIFTQTEDIVKGVGKYSEIVSIDESFVKNTPDNYVTVHGHRNIFMEEAEQFNGRVYNLNDRIEKGGHLRVLEVTVEDGINKHEVIKIKNDVFNEALLKVDTKVSALPLTTDAIINQLNSSKDIIVKELNNGVHSYNFSRRVFGKGKWNSQTMRARGLFIENKSTRIMARSYDKFFNWGENDFVKSPVLKDTFKFPVTCYKKENGFLGLVSYDFLNDDLFICSKSTNQGDFADMVRRQVDFLDKEYIKQYTKENNCTLIFEVINPYQDPHIIHYDGCEAVLLDIVANEFETKYFSDSIVDEVANKLGIRSKKVEFVFEDWESLYAWRQEQKNSFEVQHEGWVIADANGFRTKMKTNFYRFWKDMRKVKDMMVGNRKVNKRFATIEEVEVYKLMESIGIEELKEYSIIDVQTKYYGDKNHKSFIENLERASAEVSTWPEWKRNAFGPVVAKGPTE